MKKLITSVLLAVVVLASPVMAESLTEKLQALVADLSAEQQEAVLTLIQSANAGSEDAASPEEAVLAVLTDMGNAATAGDLDKVMTYFSEDFEHYEYGDKAGWKQFQQDAVDQGYWEGIEFDGSEAEIKIDGDSASVYPVDVTGAFGSLTFEYILKNEDGTWRIVEFDVSGL